MNGGGQVEMKLKLVQVPVSDTDRAKELLRREGGLQCGSDPVLDNHPLAAGVAGLRSDRLINRTEPRAPCRP